MFAMATGQQKQQMAMKVLIQARLTPHAPSQRACDHLCPCSALCWARGCACVGWGRLYPTLLFPSLYQGLVSDASPLLLSFLPPPFVLYLSWEAWMYWEWDWHGGLWNGSSILSQVRFWGQSECIHVSIWFSYFLSRQGAKKNTKWVEIQKSKEIRLKVG